jgi:hypothetical protein
VLLAIVTEGCLVVSCFLQTNVGILMEIGHDYILQILP